jgi:predicted alpha/beta hydrolase
MTAPAEGWPVTAERYEIPAADGYLLSVTVFDPDGVESRSPVIINPAMGVPQRYYAKFCRYLAAHGHRAVVFDYRGMGGRSAQGYSCRLADWGRRDFAAVVRWLDRESEPPSIAVIGHSAGGQLVGFAPNNARIATLITVAAQGGYWKLWPAPQRYLLAGLWYGLMPALAKICGVFPARALGLGESLPGEIALDWSRWSRRAEYFLGEEESYFERFTGRLITHSFDDDRYAPLAAVQWLCRQYGNRREHTHYHHHPKAIGLSRIGHFGFFRPEAEPTLWRSVLAALAES